MRPKLNPSLHLAALLLAVGPVAAPPAAAQTGDFPSALTGPVLAAWIPKNTSLRLADVISVGGGRVIALTRRSQPAGAAKAVRITIRTEIVDPAQAKAAAARSESSELDIDCAQHKAKLVVTQTYSQRDLTGTFVTKPGWADFTAPAPNTTLDRMITAACDPAFRGSFAAAPQVAALAPGPAPAAQGPAPAPTPAKTADPLPELRRATPPVRPMAAVQPPPSRAAPPAGRPPSEPAVVSAPPSAPAAKPAVVASGRPGASTGRFATLVQISASTSRAQAQASLDSLKRSLPALAAGHETLIESTSVDGQTFYRALFGGFAGAAEARSFCAALKAAGGDCLIRQR